GSVSFAGTELRDGDVVELVIAERRTIVAQRALEREEGLCALELRRGERTVVAAKEAIPRRIRERQLVDHETADRVRRMGERHLTEPRARIGILEHLAIFGDASEAAHEGRPDRGKVTIVDRCELVA